MKEIKKEAVELLEKKKIIRNFRKGYVDKSGKAVGFYRTRNKRYIEDKYADIAKRIFESPKEAVAAVTKKRIKTPCNIQTA